MRIFPPQLEIGDFEGFTKEKDIFGREELGTGLTNLVGSVTDPMVIAIDGQWGSGKTTFLKMWAGQLRQQKFPVIYFDAFENDYVEDAFAVLAGEIIGLIEAYKKSNEPRAKAFLAKAFGAGRVLARSALKIGVKVGSAGVLEATVFDEFAEAVSSEFEEITDEHIGKFITNNAERKDTLRAFKDALQELPTILVPPIEPASVDAKEDQRPLIFIIDELDRCKPVYALSVLERMKHFFAVPNVHFVLGVHATQLRNSVRAAYGESIDANRYLQKFINLTFPMIDYYEHAHDSNITKYISYIEAKLDITKEDNDFRDGAVKFVRIYALINNISLRDVEHILTNLALAAAFTKSTMFRLSCVIAGLAILRVTDPTLYVKAKLGTLRYEEAEKAFQLTHDSGDEAKRYPKWIRDWWEYCLKPEVEPRILNDYNRVLFEYGFISRHHIVPTLITTVVDRLVA